MPTDPVCGMFVPEDSDLFLDVDGQRYYFCSKTCLLKYSSPEKESRKLKNRLIVAWSLAIPIIIITYVLPYTVVFRDYLLLGLALPVQFYSGYGFYEGAYHSLKSKSANMDLLVSLGTLTAFAFSVFVTFFPKVIPSSSVYFDASSFIITLILTGNFIENLTKIKANKAASKLIEIIPTTSHIIQENGEITDKKTSEVKVSDNILVKPGEIIPADGKIYEGKSEIDESMLTGEQEPVVKVSGNEVSSGTKNLNGILKINVTRTGRDSTVSQIYELIQRASSGRAKIQRVADVFSSVFVPVVLAAAIASLLFWWLYLSSMGNPISIEIAILAFVSVVVIACPCAIGLAGPITLLIASNISYENGIIIKNSSALDRLSKVTRAVFDKTGTITESDPTVNELLVIGSNSKETVLALAASVESFSNHPVAKAIVKMATENKVKIPEATDIKENPGTGISGSVDGKSVQISRSRHNGVSAVSISVEGEHIGSFVLSYKIRESASIAINELKAMGVKVSMITGDSTEEAKRVGEIVGIDDIHAEVLPDQKSEIIKQFQMDGDYVMFTGDGINDSVALETADVGLAMGSGTDIARDSGDIILLNNDLENVVNAKIIGERTIRKIKQNIGWAFGYNTILIPIAAGILVPVFGFSVYSILPMLAALAMGMSSTSVVTNSLLLRGKVTRSLKRSSEFMAHSNVTV
jgi:Cu2+-exporting ATPase/Cu+-exporting ATPase